MLFARLAVSVDWQGKGIGAGLLTDAMLRTLNAADIAGIRALAVHAKDEVARAFYEHFDFAQSPTDPLHLFVLIKDLMRTVSRCGEQQHVGSPRKSASRRALSPWASHFPCKLGRRLITSSTFEALKQRT